VAGPSYLTSMSNHMCAIKTFISFDAKRRPGQISPDSRCKEFTADCRRGRDLLFSSMTFFVLNSLFSCGFIHDVGDVFLICKSNGVEATGLGIYSPINMELVYG
jgi:hypothetical protein